MELFLSMSIFSSAADISREKGKVQEWIRAWVVGREEYGKGAAGAPEQGKQPQQQQRQQEQQSRGAQQKKPQGRRPWVAPEFDGLNCFETIVSH